MYMYVDQHVILYNIMHCTFASLNIYSHLHVHNVQCKCTSICIPVYHMYIHVQLHVISDVGTTGAPGADTPLFSVGWLATPLLSAIYLITRLSRFKC